ncbi:Clathrin light chain [Macleaya cordata]|uniref:Clathrin light chain n=1 Tax=Macleaya cordata TaxID=56857 RepID=A0A200QRZ5_MACCD|nr:Clathrin light chain [Macleaya cordata]
MASFDTFSSNDGDDVSYIGYDARLPSERYESYSNFAGNEEEEETKVDPIDSSSDHPPPPSDYHDGFPNDEDLNVHHTSHTVESFPPSPEIYGLTSSVADEHNPESLFSSMPESNGHGAAYDNGTDIDGVFTSSDGPLLPPPTDMEPEEGVVLREWRRQNAIDLEEKEKREKELRIQIIDEADVYKRAFYEKRELNCQTNKVNNREREKLYLANQENFNKNADKQYWKSISELIPHEVPSMEKKKGRKDSERKPSVVVIQGPKPGKPTDLSRMRQLLLKLKHETPPHLILTPPEPTNDKKDGVPAAAGETPNGASDASKQEVSPTVEDQQGPELVTAA